MTSKTEASSAAPPAASSGSAPYQRRHFPRTPVQAAAGGYRPQPSAAAAVQPAGTDCPARWPGAADLVG